MHIGRVEHGGAEEGQLLVAALHRHDLPTAAAQQGDEAFMEEIGGFIVDHTAHERLRFGKGFVHDQPFGQLFHLRNDLVVDLVQHDHAPRRGAALAGGGEGGLDDRRRGIFELGRIEHNDRIVAAHFQRDDLARIGGQLAIDRDACAGGAGEQHPVDHPVFHQTLADFAPPLDALDHVLGHFGIVEAFDQEFAHGRRLFARLEQYDIARDQRGDDVAVGQVGREIIRAQHRHHAMRLVPEGSGALQRAVELFLPGAFGIGGDRDFDLADHRFNFGTGFPQRFARFARDQFGEGFGLFAHFVGEAAHEFHALARRLPRPVAHRCARAFHRLVDIAGSPAPQFVSGGRFGRKQFAITHDC